MKFINPRYVPVEVFDPARHRVERVSNDTLLTYGVDAWVVLMAKPRLLGQPEYWRARPDDGPFTQALADGLANMTIADAPARPVEFRVPIRAALPGPTLGPRDAEAMRWIDRWGWRPAVVAAERRWQARAGSPVEVRKVEERLQHLRGQAQKMDVEDQAEVPGFFDFIDEFMTRAGELANDISKRLDTIGTVIKWSAISGAVIGGGLVTARVIEAVRKRR